MAYHILLYLIWFPFKYQEQTNANMMEELKNYLKEVLFTNGLLLFIFLCSCQHQEKQDSKNSFLLFPKNLEQELLNKSNVILGNINVVIFIDGGCISCLNQLNYAEELNNKLPSNTQLLSIIYSPTNVYLDDYLNKYNIAIYIDKDDFYKNSIFTHNYNNSDTFIIDKENRIKLTENIIEVERNEESFLKKISSF